MLADEARVVPIPTRRKEASSNTPDVCEILRISGRGLREGVLFPRRTP
jgi:hypothetical protein